MKVTLDTNVLVSGTFWTGSSFRIMVLIDADKIANVTSKELLDEYYETINSGEITDKITGKSLVIMKIVDRVIKKSKVVEPYIKLNVVKDDPDDNGVLECAKAVTPDYIITKDRHLLKLREFEGIKIITPEEFLRNLEKQD